MKSSSEEEIVKAVKETLKRFNKNPHSLNGYQQQAKTFITEKANNFDYLVLGLCEEAGETAGKFAKGIRDGNFNHEEVKKELGDVLWFVAMISDKLGFTLDDVAKSNLEKLESRKARNCINGNGDNR